MYVAVGKYLIYFASPTRGRTCWRNRVWRVKLQRTTLKIDLLSELRDWKSPEWFAVICGNKDTKQVNRWDLRKRGNRGERGRGGKPDLSGTRSRSSTGPNWWDWAEIKKGMNREYLENRFEADGSGDEDVTEKLWSFGSVLCQWFLIPKIRLDLLASERDRPTTFPLDYRYFFFPAETARIWVRSFALKVYLGFFILFLQFVLSRSLYIYQVTTFNDPS